MSGAGLSDHPVQQARGVGFTEEPVEEPLRGVPLLAGRIEVVPQRLVDSPDGRAAATRASAEPSVPSATPISSAATTVR